MIPISRSEAVEAGLTRSFTGKSCPRGHIAERSVCNRVCVACRAVHTRSSRQVDGPRHQAKIKHNRRWRHSASPSDSAVHYRIIEFLRARFRKAVRRSQRTGSAVRDLGCSIPEFQAHISVQFQPGMSWENWGDWHLDHKRPLASFDLTDPEQVKLACHYTNYQPLWAVDNLVKGTVW